MKKWILVAIWVAAIAGSWELIARALAPKDQDTKEAITAVMIAKTCPEIPESMSKARSNLLWHSLKKPHTMPPWWVAQIMLTPIDTSDVEDRTFSLALCRAIAAKT